MQQRDVFVVIFLLCLFTCRKTQIFSNHLNQKTTGELISFLLLSYGLVTMRSY